MLIVMPNFVLFLFVKQVEKVNIGYAKTAKRIDIKKLKRTMWETLNSSKAQKDKVKYSTGFHVSLLGCYLEQLLIVN